MNKHTFVVIGRSGSGKGTQVELLKKYVEEKDPEGDIFQLYTGDKVREFIKGDGYSNKIARALNENGELQPGFLAVHLWSEQFIDHLTGNEHLFIDGSPRTYMESLALDSAFKFYKRERPFVINVDVSKEECVERLMARGRADDNREAIEERVGWFDTEVVPAIDFFVSNEQYHYIDVNGEQEVEKVFEEIVAGIEPHL